MNSKQPNSKYAIPFFAVLTVLTVVSFVLPLRPSVSYSEKRQLAKFPEFHFEALADGTYCNDITLWFSDTFPGRERWLNLAQDLSSFHGYGNFAIQGARPVQMNDPIPPEEPVSLLAAEPTENSEPTEPTESTESIESTELTEPEVQVDPTEAPTQPETPTIETSVPEPTAVPETLPVATEETLPAATEPIKAVIHEDALLDMYINASNVIQLDDSVFYAVGFSQVSSASYCHSLNSLAQKTDVRIVSAIPPTAVSILVPDEYMSSIASYPQDKILDYLKTEFDKDIISVNTVGALKEHQGEYLFFHTDHHWTATAAYYCYRATCEAMGMEPASLDQFEELNQGQFIGSVYGRATNTRKLSEDYVLSYIPKGSISMSIVSENGFEAPAPIVRDLRNQDASMKYVCFLYGDCPMVHLVNEDLDNGKTLLIIKDSFGNCFVPYFTMNYSHIYAIDYRKYATYLPYLIPQLKIDDVIFAPNMMSVQSLDAAGIFQQLCGLYN